MNTTRREREVVIDAWIHPRARLPILTPDEVTELAKAKDGGDVEAKAELVIRNQLLVIRRALRHHFTSDIPLTELLDTGQEGLERGIEKFQWKKGYRLSTYVDIWIRSKLLTYRKKQGTSQARHISVEEHLSKNQERDRHKFEEEISEGYEITDLATRRDTMRPKLLQVLFAKLLEADVITNECDWELFLTYFDFVDINKNDLMQKHGLSKGQIERREEIMLRKLRRQKDIGELVADFVNEASIFD